MVEAVLTALPERARAYLAHRLVDGLSQVEAAARVSMSRIQGRRIEGKFKAELLGRLRRSSQGGNP
jgi:DNA-directed RNA polymerase specialized sigma24 family protein